MLLLVLLLLLWQVIKSGPPKQRQCVILALQNHRSTLLQCSAFFFRIPCMPSSFTGKPPKL
jgi:hypothetical protein